jgi:hypothetical protein
MGKHKSGKIEWVLNHIQKLYRVEVLIRGKTPDERYRIRQEKSLPLLAEFKTWLIKSTAASDWPERFKQGHSILFKSMGEASTLYA